jgi:simple sugar transport system ATP-binding protein
VQRLTLGARQQLEILRLLSLGVQVLILDEPTTGISTVQKQALFKALRQLAADGKTVVLVSHKLEDVEQLCDHVTVLRRGRVSGQMPPPLDASRLLDMMFGRRPPPLAAAHRRSGEPLLVMDGVSARGGRSGLRDCSVTIHAGDVIGLAGLEGSGQSVFLRTAAGITAPTVGAVHLRDRSMRGADYHAFQTAGVVFLPASRIEEGLVPGLTVNEHYTLQDRRGGFWLRRNEARARAGIARFHIQAQPSTMVENLSGGNQQRLLLSFLPAAPVLLLLENPTRGLDVASAHGVWRHLLQAGDDNRAVVFSSSELDEITSVATRVLVFCDGRILLDQPAGDTSVEALGRAISGKAGR